MPIESIVAILVAAFGSGGAAWAGVKASLNGTRDQVRQIHAKVEKIDDKLDSTVVEIERRVTRLETQHDEARR